MATCKLAKEIKGLIGMKQEGAYWDFKREWYINKADMLHDIICMANNLENRDAYIIIGVDEEKDYKILDIFENTRRRNTQQIVDFLREKDFAGNICPTVYVKEIGLQGKVFDVLVIKNDRNTPYYLNSQYRDVRANHVYTRVMDTNTPKDKSADRTHIKTLWKKNFHLDASPLKRVKHYLANPDAWDHSPIESSSIQYYRYYPEYTIEKVRESRDGYEYYLFNQSDSRPYWYEINIRYHQTIIASVGGAALNGGRYFTASPCTGTIFSKYPLMKADLSYKYFIKGSLEHTIHNFYYNSNSAEANDSRERFLKFLMVFENNKEMIKFETYVKSRENQFKQMVEKVDKEQSLPIFPDLKGYRMSVFIEQYINVQALLQMFNLFKKHEGLSK